MKLDWAAELGPRLVNVLPGNDRWALGEQVDFFARAVELADASDLHVCFEIHRGRSLYSPWVTLEVIRQVPERHQPLAGDLRASARRPRR